MYSDRFATSMSSITASGSPRSRAASPAAAAPDSSNPYVKTYRPRPSTARRRVAEPHDQPVPESDIWATGIYTSSAERILRTLLGPVLLLCAAPLFVNVAALAAKENDSDFVATLYAALADPPKFLLKAFPMPSRHVVLAFVSFVGLQLALFTLVPGQVFAGARAPSGFVPQVPRRPASYSVRHVACYYFCHCIV
jgi:hypothetical protein